MKWLKIIISGLLAVLALLTYWQYRNISVAEEPTIEPIKVAVVTKKISPLSINGTRVVDSEGNDVVLKGVTTDEFRFNNIYKNVDEIKERLLITRGWGVNLVVLYLQQPKRNLERIEDIVEIANWATENDMYTLIFPVVHEYDDIPKKDAGLKREDVLYSPIGDNTLKILDILSLRLKDNDGVLYGVGAEPFKVPDEMLYNRQMEFIDTVRKNNPNSVVVISGMVWGQLLEKYIEFPPPYQNILYDVHRYVANDANNVKIDRCHLPYNYVGKVPFIVGEFGGVYSADFGSTKDLECISYFLESLKDARVGFAMHTLDYSSALGMVKENKKLTRKGKLFEKFLKESDL